jgi:hypothetical protein
VRQRQPRQGRGQLVDQAGVRLLIAPAKGLDEVIV